MGSLGLLVLGAVLGAVLSVALGLAVGPDWRRFRSWWLRKGPLERLLNLDQGRILLIYPLRGARENAILPQTATEDFLAMHEWTKLLSKVDARLRTKFLDAQEPIPAKDFVPNNRDSHAVFICSPGSNEATRDLFQAFERLYPDLYQFRIRGQDGVGIWDPKNSRLYPLLITHFEPGMSRARDHALIVKARNPYSTSKTVFVFAGSRGIGTWGAAQHLRKHYKALEREWADSGRSSPGSDFAAVIEVTYEQQVITDTKVIDFRPLPRPRLEEYVLASSG